MRLTCPNCAAQVEFDADIHATECPFCATPVVTDTGAHRHIKPKGVLPFALSEREARDAMTNWLGRLWFAPGGLQDYARKGRAMQGIYVPYWTFDADTRSAYTGERGTVYYETQTVMRDGKRQQVRVAKVRWQRTRGKVARFFDDVLVLASKSLPKRYTDALEPWDLSEMEPYAPEFLAGFRAEGYAVALEDGFEEARSYMDRIIARDIKFDIGGDLFPKLVEMGAPFYGLPMDFQWVDIGRVPDYWRAVRSVLRGDVKNVSIPGKEVAPGVYTGINVDVNWDAVDITGPVYIGAMTRIEDGAKIIGPSMIGPNCCICGNSTVDNSVIFEYSRLGRGGRLVDKLGFGQIGRASCRGRG